MASVSTQPVSETFQDVMRELAHRVINALGNSIAPEVLAARTAASEALVALASAKNSEDRDERFAAAQRAVDRYFSLTNAAHAQSN